jgi:hypothetical protein
VSPATHPHVFADHLQRVLHTTQRARDLHGRDREQQASAGLKAQVSAAGRRCCVCQHLRGVSRACVVYDCCAVPPPVPRQHITCHTGPDVRDVQTAGLGPRGFRPVAPPNPPTPRPPPLHPFLPPLCSPATRGQHGWAAALPLGVPLPCPPP